jgi:hypothetical protein
MYFIDGKRYGILHLPFQVAEHSENQLCSRTNTFKFSAK